MKFAQVVMINGWNPATYKWRSMPQEDKLVNEKLNKIEVQPLRNPLDNFVRTRNFNFDLNLNLNLEGGLSTDMNFSLTCDTISNL